jgi:hypothetical protein
MRDGLSMYNVHVKAYRVAEARARFGDLLNAAECGDTVIIERNGVRFNLQAEARVPARKSAALIDYVDPDVASGTWTWTHGPRGLRFRPRRRS